VADHDPFQDAAFVARLSKLLALLASEQPGEAEAARRKLIEHLSQSRLSLSDLANHMAGVAPAPPPGTAPSTREILLERELRAARASHAETQSALRLAQQRAHDAELIVERMAADAERQGSGRWRLQAAAVAVSLAGMIGITVLAVRLLPPVFRHPATPTQSYVSPTLQPNDPVAEAQRHPQGRRFGTVLVSDMPVRFDPSDDAGVRAFLNEGTRVLIEREMRLGARDWLFIRSGSGEGWVRASDILH
jgi:hypothetical protein